MTKKLYIILIPLAFMVLQSCKYTKYVPNGRLLLMNNKIVVNGDQNAPGEAENILKQHPNSGFWIFSPHFGFFVSPSLGVYNWGNGNDSAFFSRIGDPPVILDTSKVYTGAQQLQNWYFKKGYFNATSTYQIDSLRKNSKKAEVIYKVHSGERYYINKITKEVQTPHMNDLINFFEKKDSLIKKGDPYDEDVLEKEREKLTQIFRNEGYYNFSKNFISFEADTFLSGNRVNIKMVIAQKLVDEGDTTVYRDHEIYHINEVYIRPDLKFNKTVKPTDSLTHNGYHLIYDTLRYTPRYLTDAVHFKEGDKYDEEKVKETYSHLVGYKAFQLSQVNFDPGPRDTSGPTLIAYVNLNPLQKRTFTIEPEVTVTGGNFFGVNGSLGWINRNFLGGGEALEIRLNSGLEYQPAPNSSKPRPTTEIGTEISLAFPRFLLPFDTEGLLPKRMQPKSRTSIYYNHISRYEFDRETFGAKLSYQWRESRDKSHQIDLMDLSYSKITDPIQSFKDNLTDIQLAAFTSELISTTRYTYTINEQLNAKRKNPRYLKASAEVAGNVLSWIDQATGIGETLPNGTRGIFNVQYYQYLRVEADGRYFWNLHKNRFWVNRIYAGYILPYGNSKIATDTGVARVPTLFQVLLYGRKQ